MWMESKHPLWSIAETSTHRGFTRHLGGPCGIEPQQRPSMSRISKSNLWAASPEDRITNVGVRLYSHPIPTSDPFSSHWGAPANYDSTGSVPTSLMFVFVVPDLRIPQHQGQDGNYQSDNHQKHIDLVRWFTQRNRLLL